MENTIENASVMVVEDDPFSQQFIVQMLDSMGVYEVVKAANGQEALDLLAARQADIHLIITDVTMPEMDGYELVRRIRLGALKQFKNVPMIVLTADDTERNLQQARILKINSFFVKPPSKAVFESTIKRVIEEHEQRPTSDSI